MHSLLDILSMGVFLRKDPLPTFLLIFFFTFFTFLDIVRKEESQVSFTYDTMYIRCFRVFV